MGKSIHHKWGYFFSRVGEGAEDDDDITTEPAVPTYKKTDSFVNPGYGSMDKHKIAFGEDATQNGVVKTENGGLNGGLKVKKYTSGCYVREMYTPVHATFFLHTRYRNPTFYPM